MPSFTFVSTANAVAAVGTGFRRRAGRHTPADEADQRRDHATHQAIVLSTTQGGRSMMILAISTERTSPSSRRRTRDRVVTAAEPSAASEVQHSASTDKNVIAAKGRPPQNDDEWVEHAEIVQEKGTNRSRFRGQVDGHTWVDPGSSFLLSEISAAFRATREAR